jgi:magnesium-transporting ATPase (P-type)
MVTGDNVDTARAIAKSCNIINPNNPNSLVLKGKNKIKKILKI